ncbi:MAG: Arginine-tRNA ligase [Parcubacteria group bacterium GW2011_GWA1_47_9]|nr:MAG: Arginine-tRNA ligase [Parcubacteria group bacterium GW2011_GWA1_47_9]
MSNNLKKLIADLLVAEVGRDVTFSLERQEVEGRGDYSSNIALVRAKVEKRTPMAVAEDLASRIKEKYPDVFHAIEPAPPGFLNFCIDYHYLLELLRAALKAGAKKKILGKASVEFISANPTGPMHIGNARGGPIGDVIANLLAETGYKVIREYYHNDAGAQIARYADSLWHWYLVVCGKPSTLLEDGYEGQYVREFAGAAHKKWKAGLLKKKNGKEMLAEFVIDKTLKENFALIKKMGIQFNRVVYESALTKTKTKKVLAELTRKKLLVKKEGATWFAYKDVEAVVQKSDGTLVYFASDIAYHKDKFSRADLVVDELGEGHEGHIPKLRAVADVFGFPQEKTAREVLDEVGPDAFRYFMLQYAPRSGMVFDMELARAKSKENPVYYIQYAHARASGILLRSDLSVNITKAAWELLDSEPELALIKQILALSETIEDTARDFQLQRLARYAYELARAFTHFYETTPVIGAGGSPTSKRKSDFQNLESARLALVSITRATLARVCKLMGISSPDKM